MYIIQNNLTDDIYGFKENVFTSPMQMLIRPGFDFVYDFNYMIGKISDLGIIDKIDADFRFNNTFLNRISKMRIDYKGI